MILVGCLLAYGIVQAIVLYYDYFEEREAFFISSSHQEYSLKDFPRIEFRSKLDIDKTTYTLTVDA